MRDTAGNQLESITWTLWKPSRKTYGYLQTVSRYLHQRALASGFR